MQNSQNNQHLSRSLKNRHIQMIAIGGAIGTGLFLGSGQAIKTSGPAIILSYVIVGIFCFFMMRAIGELLLSDPTQHSFLDFVKYYLGERFEFVLGWLYWFCWISVAMADLTATGIYIKYWLPNFPQWATPLIILLCLYMINHVNVRLFGELESWFSLIKVLAIIALITIGIFLAVFRFKLNGSPASFQNLWSHGGFFATGGFGFLKSFQMIVFAFVGIEMVGITAGETEDPAKNLPSAINNLPIRIGLFYVGSMLAIMSVYPWNKISTTSSPFVQVFAAIGIPGAASLLNFVVLTAALSATNSCLFSTSRTLNALSNSGNAPQKLAQIDHNGVPFASLNFSTAVLLTVVILNFLMPANVFQLISSISTISFVIVWIILISCHLKFRQTVTGGSKLFKMPGYPWTDYMSLIFFGGFLLFLLLDKTTRIPLLFSLLAFSALYFSYDIIDVRKRVND